MLSELHDDIKFCIMSYLDVPSLLNLAATSHYFGVLVSEKTVWLDALENVRHSRPIPLARWEQASRATSAGVPLERLRSAVVCAAKIDRKWSKDLIRPTRFHRRLGAAKGLNPLQSVYHLGFCGVTLIYTANKSCICMFNETGTTITFQTRTHAACFDFDVDSEGITLIFNAVDDEKDINMEIHRVGFQDSVHRLIKDISTGGYCHSNFFEDDLAGCLLSVVGTPTYQMIVVNWRTGKFAVIDTKIERRPHITASATKKQLMIGSEGIGVMDSWFYELDTLALCVARAGSPEDPFLASLPPGEWRQMLYVEEVGRSNHPTSRGMWTGRHCFLTKYVSWAGHDSITFALIPEENGGTKLSFEGGPEAGDDEQSLLTAATTRTKFLSRKSFVYRLPDGVRLSGGAGFHYLYDIGLQGKNAVWLERDAQGDQHTCRLATFNHENDSKGSPVSGAVSTIVFQHEEFHWGNIQDVQLDDNSGVLTCFTDTDIWTLYFD